MFGRRSTTRNSWSSRAVCNKDSRELEKLFRISGISVKLCPAALSLKVLCTLRYVGLTSFTQTRGRNCARTISAYQSGTVRRYSSRRSALVFRRLVRDSFLYPYWRLPRCIRFPFLSASRKKIDQFNPLLNLAVA